MIGVGGLVLEVGQDRDQENGSDLIPLIMVVITADHAIFTGDINLADAIPDLDQEAIHLILQDQDHRLGLIHLPVLIHLLGLTQSRDLLHHTIKPGVIPSLKAQLKLLLL